MQVHIGKDTGKLRNCMQITFFKGVIVDYYRLERGIFYGRYV